MPDVFVSSPCWPWKCVETEHLCVCGCGKWGKWHEPKFSLIFVFVFYRYYINIDGLGIMVASLAIRCVTLGQINVVKAWESRKSMMTMITLLFPSVWTVQSPHWHSSFPRAVKGYFLIVCLSLNKLQPLYGFFLRCDSVLCFSMHIFHVLFPWTSFWIMYKYLLLPRLID